MAVEITPDFAELNRRLEKLVNPNFGELSSLLAAEGESQTRRRISQEKTATDGSQWAAWSNSYAATRHGGHQLLESDGHLLDGLLSDFDDSAAYWGSNLVQAAAMNFGVEERNLEAREFLGLSEDNKRDMLLITDDWTDGLMGL